MHERPNLVQWAGRARMHCTAWSSLGHPGFLGMGKISTEEKAVPAKLEESFADS
jgi:diketogulonate reductase-like aldo/keto reductase